MRRRSFLKQSALGLAWALNARAGEGASAGERPNILWLSAEDISPLLGCYGDAFAHTPNLDRFAAEGIR